MRTLIICGCGPAIWAGFAFLFFFYFLYLLSIRKKVIVNSKNTLQLTNIRIFYGTAHKKMTSTCAEAIFSIKNRSPTTES